MEWKSAETWLNERAEATRAHMERYAPATPEEIRNARRRGLRRMRRRPKRG